MVHRQEGTNRGDNRYVTQYMIKCSSLYIHTSLIDLVMVLGSIGSFCLSVKMDRKLCLFFINMQPVNLLCYHLCHTWALITKGYDLMQCSSLYSRVDNVFRGCGQRLSMAEILRNFLERSKEGPSLIWPLGGRIWCTSHCAHTL